MTVVEIVLEEDKGLLLDFNVIAADDLVTRGARSSAAMILTLILWNIAS